MLCTVVQIKERLGLQDKTDPDAVLATIIAGLLPVFEGVAGRPLIVTAADVTEYYSGQSEYLHLDRYPVVAITSVKESYTFDFDNATALTADTDYRLLKGGRSGILKRLYQSWLQEDDGIQVIYRGGYCAAGVTPAAGEHALPADLNEVAILQGSFIYKRKDDPGLSGISFEGGGFQKYAQDNLLPIVRETLLRYARLPV